MDKGQQDHKKFLEEQLQWCKEQDGVLEELNVRLHEMKEIAEYASEHELTKDEIHRLNNQLYDLEYEIHSLEKQLHSVIH